MEKFYVTKAVAADKIINFVDTLNTMTCDSYVADQIRITGNVWLLRVACSRRDDAALVRGL